MWHCLHCKDKNRGGGISSLALHTNFWLTECNSANLPNIPVASYTSSFSGELRYVSVALLGIFLSPLFFFFYLCKKRFSFHGGDNLDWSGAMHYSWYNHGARQVFALARLFCVLWQLFLRWAGSVLKETLFVRNSKVFPGWLRCWCRYEIMPLLFDFIPWKEFNGKILDQKGRLLNFGDAPVFGWTLTFHVLKIKAKGLSLSIRQPTMSCRLLLVLSVRIYYALDKSLYEEMSCWAEVWPIKGFFSSLAQTIFAGSWFFFPWMPSWCCWHTQPWIKPSGRNSEQRWFIPGQ